MDITNLVENYSFNEKNDPYVGSKFEKYRNLTSKAKGAVGERWFDLWATSQGLTSFTSTNAITHGVTTLGEGERTSDFDRVINSKRFEIKFSTIWKDANCFKFQQLRESQNYDYIVFGFVYPNTVELFYIEKSKLDFSSLKGQHGGVGGTDTRWLSVKSPQELPHGFKSISELVNEIN